MTTSLPTPVLPTIALGMAFLVGACTVGPDWHKPIAATSHGFMTPPGTAAASRAVTSPMDPDWWDIYHDPELTALERHVASANLDLREASARLDQSRAERGIAAADRYPIVGGNVSYARERASPNGVLGLLGTGTDMSPGTVANGTTEFGPSTLPGSNGSAAFDLFQGGLDSSWELDLWGRVRRAVEGADANLEQSEDMRRDILVTVLADTARDYVQLRGVQAQLIITQQNLQTARHSLALAQARFSFGATTQLDVADAAAQVAAIQARVPALEKQQAHLVNAISFLAGEAPRALQAELATALPLPPMPSALPIGLPSELAERRPDIRRAGARLHQATAAVGIAVADFYPRVTLSGSLDIQALQFTGLGTWNSRQYGIGPQISLPIFEGGRLRGELRLRKGQQQEAAIDYQRTVLKAWHEVDDALTDYNAAQNQRDRLDEAVRQNKVALAIAQMQYAQGATGFLNVLTVQNLLLRAQSDSIQASSDTDVALVGVYKALGGGWQANFNTASITAGRAG